MPYADLSDVRLYYEREGQGHPVVFIHAHSLDCRMWNDQVGPISRSYAVVRYDVRGHGRSTAPQTGYSTDDYARDLRGLADHLGLRKHSIVGLSLGGNIAIAYALMHPERVETVTLINSGLLGFGESPVFHKAMEKRRALVQREGVSEKFVRATIMSAPFDRLRHDPAKKELVRSMVASWSGASYLDTTVYPPSTRDYVDRVQGIKAPTLVLVGELDGRYFHQVADVLASKIPVVRKYVVPGAGHFVSMETPQILNELLLDFLGGAVGKALV
jgi:pimeloyl-ACP methyl ester carboxylesterase